MIATRQTDEAVRYFYSPAVAGSATPWINRAVRNAWDAVNRRANELADWQEAVRRVFAERPDLLAAVERACAEHPAWARGAGWAPMLAEMGNCRT
jgi:hypothetical protein